MTRPDSTTVAARLVAYLYRTGKLDWAGGRWAEYERTHNPTGFDAVLGPVSQLEAGLTKYPLFNNGSVGEPKVYPNLAPPSGGVFLIKAIRSKVYFDNLNGAPEPSERKPLGFWPLVEHNFSIGYAGDIRATREEAERDGDAEAVAICDLLLAMKRTAREKVGDKVEDAIDKRGRK